ncbi:MAG: helicase [Roseofilum sp. SBFL]|uniref:helicase-related protein n=1 Tax=unclassified Roseofilum TaxID=2620099 RepID=UPI001B217EF4|nr:MULTISPECIES: helicase-related protein [unclassified Roseofilum]MBP0012333.1 helicase [Roseofilum sp. SID3]MBP0022655.1 helicase [Roseofilum sp. SID2]MBP0036648.1 helicase [Roseofilum sp. SID1]MBP0042703.1 helicase [Roseofilum sp. SBFL]
MAVSFLEQASLWGQGFEIAVKRGVLLYLIEQKLLDREHQSLTPWKTIRVGQVSQQLEKKLSLTDPEAKEWVGTMMRHLWLLGYGLGWTAMRECLKYSSVDRPKLDAIWCPLVLPGQPSLPDEERTETAQTFQKAFGLPGQPDLALVNKGQPARADFFLWLSREKTEIPRRWKSEQPSQKEEAEKQKVGNTIVCLEFSYNTPGKLADFRQEPAHLDEISRYARLMESRGVFSRVRAEVEGEGLSFSPRLANHLFAFSSQDKPLYKLCQASSYIDRLIRLLYTHKRLDGGSCLGRAIAITPNGFESLAALFRADTQNGAIDPRVTLMKSLGEAYRNQPTQPNEKLDTEIQLVFNKLLKSLPKEFKDQVKALKNQPEVGEDISFTFQEQVERFYHPMQPLSREEAIAAIEETPALCSCLGENPKAQFSQILDRYSSSSPQVPLRHVHAAAVVAGLKCAQRGRINAIALEGNPGIGKTTAVIDFLNQQSEGFLFLYISPRVVINREVTTKLAKKEGKLTGIATLTTNSHLISLAPKWYANKVQPEEGKKQAIDSAVVIDGLEHFNQPQCNILFINPEQEHEIDSNFVHSKYYKASLSEREDQNKLRSRPGVLKTLAQSARKLQEVNPKFNRFVLTAATQGYRKQNSKTTVHALSNLFAKKADTKPGQNERLKFSQQIPTIVVMVDELAGDGAGAPFVRELGQWLEQQFIRPFEGKQSPFKVILIVADASLSNEVVLNRFLNPDIDKRNTSLSKLYAPDKVLISESHNESAFRVTATQTKIGLKTYPMLHVMTNSYPATELKIDYRIHLSKVILQTKPDGNKQTIRQAIREQHKEHFLNQVTDEINRALKAQAQQIIFFAQDKVFLRKLEEQLTVGESALLQEKEVAVLDQSVPPDRRLKLIQEENRDRIRIFLMTSSGARGVSFPRTDWIIAAIPRFNIEASLMEIAQLIYRGRGMYTDPETQEQVSGDNTARQLVMLINDYIVIDEEVDSKRVWLRQTSDLLTLLMMLRSTLHTRIKGDAGLRKQRIAFVPVGAIGDEELLSLMAEELWNFVDEAPVFIYDSRVKNIQGKGVAKKALEITNKIFSDFKLKGFSKGLEKTSYTHYQNLDNFIKVISAPENQLLLNFNHDKWIISENLTAIGPFWIEEWRDRQAMERFNFQIWNPELEEQRQQLLKRLKYLFDYRNKIPPKLKHPAKELYQFLSRETADCEYSVFQDLKTQSFRIGLPLDYPHFWHEHLEEDYRKQELQDPESWRKALGRSLTPQGLVIPVIAKYQEFPWVAVAGEKVFEPLEMVFSDRYFMASSELNLLNILLLEDDLNPEYGNTQEH